MSNKMTYEDFWKLGCEDAATNQSFHPAYDGWSITYQHAYEEGRLSKVVAKARNERAASQVVERR